MEVDDRLRAWVCDRLGPTHAWTRLDAGRTGNVVFGLVAADGSAWIAKRLASARGFAQERGALREWFGGTTTIGGARVPRLLADHAGLRAVLLDRLPGQPVDPSCADAEVHRAAGEFLAALHGLVVVDDDPVTVAEALARRVAAWRGRVAATPALDEILTRHGPRPALFEGARRVACHRDYTARNWLWDSSTLAVVDFEHARLDLGWADLAKLWVDVWADQPGLEAAFWLGYGRQPTERERQQLRACVVVHGLASLAWGQQKRDPVHISEGRRALDLAAAWPD